MQLPRVKIQFLTGQLGTVGDSPDGLFALVCGAAAVGSTFALNTAYEVTSMDSVQALGVTLPFIHIFDNSQHLTFAEEIVKSCFESCISWT